eukprot:sb/3478759/
MPSDRGSRFEKFTNAKLLGSHCIPHKSCRELSGGHFGTRFFILAQCSGCLMTTTCVSYRLTGALTNRHANPVMSVKCLDAIETICADYHGITHDTEPPN